VTDQRQSGGEGRLSALGARRSATAPPAAESREPTAGSRPSRAPALREKAASLLQRQGAVVALVAVCVFGTMRYAPFATPENLLNVLRQNSMLGMVALGMTLVILTEGIDLSLGAVLGLCGVVMALALASHGSLPIAIGAAVLVGVIAGCCNGALVAYAGMPPFIVTLGVYGIAQSLAMVLTQGNSVTGLPPAVRWFNEGSALGLPVPILAMAAVFALTWVLLYRTRFGRYVFAIGGNRRALELTGVRVRAWLVAVYAFAGLLAALASFIMTARMNAAHPTIAIGLEFDAIAAVILGGTSFEKGNGGIWGTLVGALAVAVLRNGLNLIGLGTEWQVAVVGLVIVSAVAVDALRGRA
jgi:ribose transport system permease protein